MEWVWERDGRALRRIVALLLALAQLAERAGSMSLPVRVIVLGILRHAELVAWAFAREMAAGPTAPGVNHQPLELIPPGAPCAGHHGHVDAARLALSLRALALILAHWAIRAVSSNPRSSSPFGRRALVCARSGGTWRGPTALPAPDTS